MEAEVYKMASQDCEDKEEDVMKLLGEVAGWSVEETIQQLPIIIPQLIDFLQSSPPAQTGVHATRFAFGSFLPHMEVGQTAFHLFNAAFPFLNTSIDDLLQDIEREKESMDKVSELLQQCILVVECCAVGLQFLLQVERVAVEDIRGVPEAVLHVLTSTLQHCRHSEKHMKQVPKTMEGLRESLSSLFSQAVELSLHLASLLPNLTFDTLSHLDTCTLVTVCQEAPCLSVSLSEACEVRGCVLLWRGFSSLVHRHHTTLVTLLDPAPPLAALVAEVRSSLLLIPSLANAEGEALEEKDRKVLQRVGKMATFCVKVVVGLCERFRGYLQGAHHTLISLVRLLYRFRCSGLGVQGSGQRVEEVTETGRQVALGIEPLLDHLREDHEFVKMVLAVGRKDTNPDKETTEEEEGECEPEVEDGWTSHLLLLVALPLPSSPTTALCLNTVIARVFQCLPKCHSSLSLPCQLEGVMCGGRAVGQSSLYQHVLVRVCAAAATIQPNQFHQVEDTLLSALISPHPWTSLLAADLWCFITRYGSSEVCLNHCCVLVEVLHHTASTSPQHLAVTALLARLTTKLTPQHRQHISHTLSTSTAASQLVLARLEAEQDTADGVARSFVEECTCKMELILSRSATGQVVFSLIKDLQEASPILAIYIRHKNTTSDPTLAKFAHTLVQLWSRVPISHTGSTVAKALVWSLLQATIPLLYCLSNIQLLQVLSKLREIVQCGEFGATVGTGVCELVAALGTVSLPPTTPNLSHILSLIAGVVTELLESANPLVYQAALDAFVAFGCHTQHEDVLVGGLGGCREEVQARVTAYLQREPQAAPQSWSSLLHTQDNKHNTAKNFKNIDDKGMVSQISNHPSKTVQGLSEDFAGESKRELTKITEEPGEKLAKRRREYEENLSPDNFGSLLNSLKQCHNVMKSLKEDFCTLRGGDVPDEIKRRRREVRSVLVEMLSFLDTETL
ncbi:hypothetical protein Pcinc_011066 [Petrolisthes cinctipes]|uniref:Uncharacterized protein n=1 Tax=Petrolisthes cinctipes TaxID=88211 RepID=A0AAE1G1M5_PETCI|nr:hypothetical protein Pcinc_011066 [Petrolisthes cinctipes]